MWLQHRVIEQSLLLMGRDPDGASASVMISEENAELNSFERWIEEKFRFAGLDRVKRRYFHLRIGLEGLFSILIGALSGKLLLIPLIFAAAMGVELTALNLMSEKRSRIFEGDYTALLLSLASAIRTGIDPLIALMNTRELFSADSLVKREIEDFKDLIDKGFTEESAIRSFAVSVAHPDIDLFRSAFILARREGTSLSQCLQRLAKVTRQRQSFRRKVKSAVAMQKLSAFGIGACAVAMGLIQFSANPEGVMNAYNDPVGFNVMLTGVVLITLGIILLLRMARG